GPPPGALVRAPARPARPGLSRFPPPPAGRGHELLLRAPRQPLDPVLLPERLAPALDLARPGEHDGKARARVTRGSALLVRPERGEHVLGRPRVERAVAAGQEIDEGHPGVVDTLEGGSFAPAMAPRREDSRVWPFLAGVLAGGAGAVLAASLIPRRR